MRHGSIVQKVLMHVSQLGWRMFKNAVGSAWHGQVTEEYMISDKKGPQKVIELWRAHRITYGLRRGSSDLVGWRTRRIKQEDVGKKIAQFSVVECKTVSYSKATEEQRNFLDQVKKAGGYAAIARQNGDNVELEEI